MIAKSKDAQLDQLTHSALKIIMESSPVGIVVFGSDARIIYANLLASEIFGKSSTEVSGLRCGNFIDCANRHKDNKGCGFSDSCADCPLFQAICSSVSGGSSEVLNEGKAFLKRDSGLSNIWVKYKVTSVIVEGSKFALMTVDDITGYKQDEEKLNSALTELSVIHEHAPIAMMLVDKDRRVCKVNGFVSRFADRPADEMIGLRGGEALRCLHHLDDPKGCGFGSVCIECQVRMAVLETFDSRVSQENIEAWLPFIRGNSVEHRCLLISTAHLKIDNSERVLVCAQDITDRKKAEQALKEGEEKHRRLFETMSQGVIYQDATGSIISANPSAERILGLSLDQMLGKTSMDPRWKMIREDGSDVPGNEHPAMQALQTGQKGGPVTRGVFHPDKNAHIWLSITAIPLFEPGETTPFQVYATFDDITKQKQAEEKIKHLNEVLRAIRNVNQLITQEKDRDQLLHKCCQNLVETRGYHNAWIGLIDGQNNLSGFYSAGLGDKALILKEHLEKKLPLNCLESILEGERVLVLDDPYSQCSNCPLKTRYKFRAGLSGRLEYQGRFFGIISVSTPGKVAHDKEELELFEELADDISFALHNLEREEERKEHLENLRMYELIISTVKDPMSIVDRNYVYKTINKAYLDTFSKGSKDEIVGHTVENLLGSKVFHGVVKPRLDRCFNGEEVHYEEWFDTPIGEKVCREIHYYPYLDQKGDVQGVIVNVRDITEQKRMETAIKESHQRVLTVLNNINLAVYVTDLDSHDILFVNQYVRNNHGDVEGEKCWSIVQSNQKSQCDFCTNEKLVDPEGNPTGVYRWEFQNTKTGKWYDCHDSAIKWTDGRLVRMEIAIDITDRKQAEDQLNWQSRLQALLLSISSKYINISLENIESSINSSLYELGKFVGADRSYIFHYHFEKNKCTNVYEWCRDGIDAQINALQSVPLSTMQDLVKKHSNGEPWYIPDVFSMPPGAFQKHLELQNIKSLLTVPMMLDNECIGFVGFDWVRHHHHFYSETEQDLLMVFAQMLVNIYLRKQNEDALWESENKYRTLVENANDIIYTLSSDGIFTYVSPNWTHLLGHEISEVQGHSFAPFVHPDDVSACSEFLRKVFESGEKQSGVEYRVLHKNGQWRWHTSNASAKRDKNGRITEFIGIARDITEQKQAEEEKEKIEAQFMQAQKMESVGRLAGGVAHDINNKLNVILGYAEFVQESLRESEQNHDFMKEIIDATIQSTDIVGQLLAFARKQIINPKVCDLNTIIESMLKMLRRLIGEDIDLSWSPESQLWAVKIDPAQIDQILANLCVNARDAIAGVGKITIETDNVTIDEKYCSGKAQFLPGEYVMLAVSDNGEGMDKETLDNIFEPFFTTKPVGLGTGLGLATVYGIVKQNHGFINVYSEPDKGTTFKVYFPRHIVKVKETQTESAVEIPRGHGETVLLVEDEKPIMTITKLMLENLGYQVLTADTPGKALHLAEEHSGKIHLLITDVVMPEMNGRNLADQIEHLYPKIKNLFMSGYTANVIAQHGVLDKGVHFIQKPFSKKDLAVKLRKVLEQS